MKNNRSIIIILMCMVLILIVSTSIYYILAPYFRPIYSGNIWNETKVSHNEEILQDFVTTKLTDDGGIYTNYLDLKSEGDITKGHAVLSESEGLMLLYNLKKGDREGFDYTLNYVKKNMMLDTKLLSWRAEEGKTSNISATIDDLRIVKSLLIASEKWNDISYRVQALTIAKGIHKYLLDKNILIDFNDGIQKSNTATLCYLDLPTLKMLANVDYISWKKVYDEALKTINCGYISDSIPLYAKNFNITEKSYDSEDIDTLLSMIVILNKAEAGEDISRSLQWIKDEFKKNGIIVTSYSKTQGNPTSTIESTSIYSLIVQIASEVNDEDLEKIAMDKMKSFQVENQESEIYGGYGSEDTLEVYSYDNLNALLAYRSFRD